MMTARVITTILQPPKPIRTSIVVMTLAVIMGGGHHASQKYETHPLRMTMFI